MKKIPILILMCVCGCTKHSVQTELDRAVDCTIEKAAHATWVEGKVYESAEKTLRRIMASSNTMTRVQSLSRWAEKLFSVDTSKMSFDERRNWFINVREMISEEIVFGLIWSRADVEKVFDIRLCFIEWQRFQLEKMKPTRRINAMPPAATAVANAQAYCAWQQCYLVGASSLQDRINRLERDQFPAESAGLSRAQADGLRKMIERRLGRSLRSSDEARLEFWNRSETYHAVERGELAP